MSEYEPKGYVYPDFTKPTPEQLPDPAPGYKWVLVRQTHDEYAYQQRPIRKLYDWSKTGPNVLVFERHGEAALLKVDASGPDELVHGVWQAHIGGDPCPVDPDATMVRYRRNGETFGPAKAGNIGWDIDTLFEVTGLVEGHSYDR